MSTAVRPAAPFPSGTPKSLLRRPTTVRKREDDDTPEASSPSKRSKVSFDSDVEVRVVEEWEKAPAVIQEEVRRSIQRHLAGDNTSYHRIKAIYLAEEDGEDVKSSTTVKNYTIALLANVSTLDNSCSDLISAVLNSDWLIRTDDYVRLFTTFLANLVSAQGLYLVDVLRMLVENLTSGSVNVIS